MLYQQNQKIEIVVRKEEGGASTQGANEVLPESNAGNGGEGQRGGWRAVLAGSTSIKRQNRVFKTNATHLLAVTRQVGNLAINYLVGGIAYRNGDQALQDATKRTIEVWDDGASIVSAVSMGALYGSWGGPLGTAMGAVLGLASSTASIGVKYANREREYNTKLFKEYNGISYLRARSSINLTTGRLR